MDVKYRDAMRGLLLLGSLQRRGYFVRMDLTLEYVCAAPDVDTETQEVVMAGLMQIASGSDVMDVCDLIGGMLDLGYVIPDQNGWVAIYQKLFSSLDSLVIAGSGAPGKMN